MPPDEPTDEERQEQLPQDGETPFRPADPSPASTDPRGIGRIDSTHPATDTNLQPEELYDQGVAGAAGVSEPNPEDNPVTDYTPPSDADQKPPDS